MISIVLWGPLGGIISSLLAYPYGLLAMVLSYFAGFMVFSLVAGLFTYSRTPIADHKGL